jgi:hypothetical protein
MARIVADRVETKEAPKAARPATGISAPKSHRVDPCRRILAVRTEGTNQRFDKEYISRKINLAIESRSLSWRIIAVFGLPGGDLPFHLSSDVTNVTMWKHRGLIEKGLNDEV